MSKNEILEQRTDENEQVTQENDLQKSDEKLLSEDICSMSKKVQDFINESKDSLTNSVDKIKENNEISITNVENLSLSFVNQKLQVNDECMEIEDHSQIQKILIEESADSIDIDQTNDSDSKENSQLFYDWKAIKLICLNTKEFKPTENCENFTKGCHWSPDGTCILVPSEDFKIRLFDLPRELYSGKLPKDFSLPSFDSSVRLKEGGTIYDICWFPYMNSWDPSTCCFLSASQGSPIHLWDAFTGQLRATYRPYNQVDEVEAALSVQFTDYGSQIWSGFKNYLKTFDTERPGRHTNTVHLKKDFPSITGLVSCIKENPAMSGLIAFGTYSKYIGLYKDGPLCSFETSSGVTQIEFSPCGTKLYSSVRKGCDFLCWDLRNPGSVLYSLQNRQSDTNQRIHFSLSYSGEEIVSGGIDGAVRVWKIPNDLQVDEDLDPLYKIQIMKDCINGVSLHKNLPLLAVSTGSRICDEELINNRNNSIRFYWLDNR